MMAAKREMPIGGRRAKMGTGRARSSGLNLLLSAEHKAGLSRLAEVEGVTRTALIERWIDQHLATLPPDNPLAAEG